MTPPSLIRWASCRNLVKYSWNLRWNSARSLAYTTCSDVADSSLDTSHTLEKLGKFKVINETLDQLKRERSSALLFLRELKESGFKHDIETYMSVVRLLCNWDWGMDVRADKLLNDVIDNTNWKVDWKVEGYDFISEDLYETLMEEKLIKAVEVLVKVYARAGRFGEAIYYLFEMARGGVMVSTRTCNFVLSELIKQEDDLLQVEGIYIQMKMYGLILNERTYALVIEGLCKRGCWKEAGDVLEKMETAGIEPNALHYSRYISGLCCKGKTDLAFQLVKKLRESNKKQLVDVFAYGCVIRGFVKELKLQDASDAFLDMKLRGLVPDGYCYCILIAGYCQKGDIYTALVLCKEMESNGIKSNRFLVRWMMQYLCRRFGRLDEALCMFKHFTQQSGVFIDGVSFNIAIEAACILGKMDDVMGLVEEMKARKIKPVVMQPLGSEPTGVEDQWDQPNMGQDEGVEGVSDAGVQSEGGHDGVVQDARDQAAVCYVGQLHTTQENLALHKLSSLNAHHDVILKKLRESVKMKYWKAVYDKDGGGSSLDKPVPLDEA